VATLPAWLDWVRPARRSSPFAEVLTGRPRARGSLVASAAVITAQEGARLAKASKRREWQRASFGYARALPEVGYAMRFLANNAAHIRLYAGDRPDGADEVAELTDEYGWIESGDGTTAVYDTDALPDDLVQAARSALNELTGYSPSGGGAAILSPLTRNYEQAGECYLVGRYYPEADNGQGREEWAIRSISELTFQDGRFRGMNPELPPGYFRLVTGEGRDSEAVDLDPATTTVVRLWTADAEWSSEPDSPMRSLIGVCERLLLIEKGDDAALRSRASGNGVLLWPEELDALPDEDDEEDEFDRDFVTQLTTPLTLDGSAAQVVPMIKRGAYQYLDRVRHLTFGRPLDPLTNEREARLLTRLGIGLDVPPEVITGLSDVNHWNAWQISSDTFRHHQEPITIAAVEGLTLGYMRHRLRSVGAWPENLIRRVVVWFDPSGLVAPADMSSAANDAYDRGLIDGRAYRELRGIDESHAPPEEVETGDDAVGETGLAVERLLQVATIADRLLRAGYEPDDVNRVLGLSVAHTGAIPGVPPSGPAALPAGDAPAEEPTTPEAPALPAASAAPLALAAAAAPTDRQRRLSRRLANIERTLRERIAAAADAALLRALERAGNRARAAAQREPAARDAVAGQPPEQVLASLGRPLVAALGLEEQQLLAEAFGRLREQYTEWTATAAEEALDAAVGIADLDRTDPDVARQIGALRDRFADNADASWPVLEGGLRDLAADRLYDPDPTVDPVGELPSSIVPPGLVRDALAVVGGVPGDDSGTGVRNGLTSGELLDGFLRDHGQEVVEYEWSYGISARPFRPHANLDGVVFASFDDDALDTSGTGGEWIGGSFAPGDHKGCHCDYVPVYTDGRDTRAELETIGRRAYEEQNPGRPIPTRDATVDERVYLPDTGRPEQRPTSAVEAARAARNGAPEVTEERLPGRAPSQETLDEVRYGVELLEDEGEAPGLRVDLDEGRIYVSDPDAARRTLRERTGILEDELRYASEMGKEEREAARRKLRNLNSIINRIPDRIEQRSTPAPAARPAVRNGPPVVSPPTEPVRPRRQQARGRTRQAATDEAGIPMRLDYTYLSALTDEQLDDLAVHLTARMDSLDPREGQRWDDLDAFLTYTDENKRIADDLAERMASDGEWQEAYEHLDATLGRPGVTHPRVGGHGSRDGMPTRAEVQEEYALHVEQQYVAALEVVKTHGVNAAGQARGIDVRDLLAGDIRLVYRYASPELLEFLEGNRRISWTEYYFARTGKGNAALAAKHAAENAGINRDRTGRSTRR